ncbi:MAG: MFS transporter, partial [Alphaproteobacteria bacterium]
IGVAFFVTSYGANWRIAFWIGAAIAIVSMFARTRLRETPDFLEMKRKWLKKEIHETNIECDPLHGAEFNSTWKEPVEGKTLMSYFFISCGGPLTVYLAYFYFNSILQNNFGYSSGDIIKHNFFLALAFVFFGSFITFLSYYVHPLKITKARGVGALLLMICIPFLIMNATSAIQLFIIQALILMAAFHDMPSAAVFMSHFPLYRRVTYASLLWSISRALVYAVTSFGLVYLSSAFGHYGIWVISLPVGIGFLYGIKHFEGLERKRGWYPSKSQTPSYPQDPVSQVA